MRVTASTWFNHSSRISLTYPSLDYVVHLIFIHLLYFLIHLCQSYYQCLCFSVKTDKDTETCFSSKVLQSVAFTASPGRERERFSLWGTQHKPLISLCASSVIGLNQSTSVWSGEVWRCLERSSRLTFSVPLNEQWRVGHALERPWICLTTNLFVKSFIIQWKFITVSTSYSHTQVSDYVYLQVETWWSKGLVWIRTLY